MTEPNNQDLVPQDEHIAQKLPDLSGKQREFIENLLRTGRTWESYKAAGYTGSYSASYELRRRLLPWIKELSGCCPSDVFKRVRDLNDMPVTDGTVTFSDKLKLLKLQAKLAGLDKDNTDAKTNNFTQFVINRSEPSVEKIPEKPPVVDVKAEE